MSKKILLIQGRGLGDAIISKNAMQLAVDENPDIDFEVLCSYHNLEVFTGFTTHPIDFPVNKKSIFKVLLNLPSYISLIHRLNQRNYDCLLDVYGGWQERIFSILIRAKSKFTGKNFINNPLRRMLDSKPVLNGCGIYKFYEIFFRDTINLNIKMISGSCYAKSRIKTIGISPFGGGISRRLSTDQLLELIQLLDKNFSINLYLEKNIDVPKSILKNEHVAVHTLQVNEFIDHIINNDLFIGMDSFGVHAAYYQKVPSIFINTSNDHQCWAPPGVQIENLESCSCKIKPCFNKPKCIGRPEYMACVNELSMTSIVHKIINC